MISSNRVLLGIRKPRRLYFGIPGNEKELNRYTVQTAPKDTANYRAGYPELQEVPYLCRG